MADGASAVSHNRQDHHWVEGNVKLTDDEVQRGLGSASCATGEQVLDGGAGLQTHGGRILPPGDGAPLSIYEALLKDVVEDIFEVEEERDVAHVEELCGDLLVCAGRLVVGDPELGGLDFRAMDLRAVRRGHVCVERNKGRGWSAGERREKRVWRSYCESPR
jgi:hypothetical protein